MDQYVTPRVATKTVLRALGLLVHELQLERGCAALYLDSEGALFKEEFETQTPQTDSALAVLQVELARLPHSILGERIKLRLSEILEICEGLGAHRTRVEKFGIPFSEAVNAYTYHFNNIVLNTMTEAALFAPDADPQRVTAYTSFLQWKERVGRERAWGMHGFCAGSFESREFVERMLELVVEQRSFRSAILSLASSDQREVIEESLADHSHTLVHRFHDLLENPEKSGQLEKITPVEWFQMMTAKIDRMKEAEDRLITTLAFDDGADDSIEQVELSVESIEEKLERFIPLLRALPLFASLSESEFERLRGQADIRRYEKGRLLFFHGEPASRYIVVLSGWVKLYKGTEGGEEVVLQMLTSGESVQDAAVFLNAPAPVSAQIAEDAVLFSVPAPLIRQAVRDSAELAVNMLDSMSKSSEGLIKQMEQSRLHSANERVGWFLLKRQLEDGGPKVGTIVLPYDKSLIASYLDMTPETFSRTLKRFRDQGFTVKYNTIVVPAPYDLCEYCDAALGGICRSRGDKGCPKADFGKAAF